MKILMAAPYLYDAEKPEFTRNKTGFGIMVRNIVDAVSKYHDIAFVSYVITSGDGKKIAKHLWKDVFVHCEIKDIFRAILIFFKYSQKLSYRARYAYYVLNRGYFKNFISRFKPDIVHIHGISIASNQFIEVCEKLHVPYVVTSHGIIGMNSVAGTPYWECSFEKKFFLEKRLSNNVSVISSGMKKRIENFYLDGMKCNLVVINNGTNITDISENNKGKLDLRSLYNINENEKIISVIGSICNRKNQKQIVSALSTGLIKTPCHIFLFGTDATNGEIKKQIDENSLSNNVHLMGFLNPKDISVVLKQTDINIVASVDEGFGLSIIEAGMLGVPTVTFANLDAVSDLFNNNAMLLVEERTDISLATAVEKALQKDWDKIVISNFFKKFSLDAMAQKYCSFYNSVINDWDK